MEYSSGEGIAARAPCLRLSDSFLYIEMKHLNGIETAKKLRAMHSTAQIIFVTSYQDFVFQEYEVRALNYIMKPYQAGKITEVLHTALKELDYTAQKYFVVQKKMATSVFLFLLLNILPVSAESSMFLYRMPPTPSTAG